MSGVGGFLRTPQVVWVLGGSLIGRLPLGAAPLVLLLFARETMSIGLAGLVVGAYSAGTAIGQPLLSRLADRWRQPPVLWAAVALSTLGLIVTALRPGTAAMLVAAVLIGVGAPPFESCLRVLWKDLVPPELVHVAYTVDVTAQELIFIVGPVLALGAIGLGGSVGGLVAIGVVQLVGTLIFATAPVVNRWRGETVPRHWAGPLRSAALRLLLAATLLVGAGVGSTVVAVTGYAEAAGSRSWAGWLLAAQATGALIGGLLFARHQPADLRRSLPGIVGLLAVSYLPLLLVPGLPVMVVLLVVSGAGLPAMLTAVFISADKVAPAGTAAESFAWVATAFAVGSAAGSAVDGALLDASGSVAVGFLPAPLAIGAASALLLRRRRGGRQRSRAI
ncbi:putative MFS family arabinose efflux permease [Allocatelliglobosispora scoriae]|uniref:Putative MFS family arabinose efflux permease n=1 Tax=Allocatelliglobosispora scoriae TaxID=643052 RepID=A0A841BNQ6_9ACTN|nr:MFS transporter [Allocatelliglobosispora scoriae]MBB5869018.1 putative MFS family arabinose efflux permease [Allocatelliglobosispora scoriae]